MSNDFAGLALHTWTVDALSLPEALATAKAAGYDALELRRVDFLRSAASGLSNDQTLDLIRSAGLPVALVGVEPGWIFATGDESRRLWDVFRETCRNAVALGCKTLMSASGPLSGTVAEAIPNMRIAGDIAAEHGLTVAFEFNSQHPVLNRLEVAREILAGAGRENCGLLLDAYHLHRSGRPGRGFEDVAGEEIAAFQYSDVPADADRLPPTERLPPGDGLVEWVPLLRLLSEKGWRGYLSYEAPNSSVPKEALAGSVTRAAERMRGFVAEV